MRTKKSSLFLIALLSTSSAFAVTDPALQAARRWIDENNGGIYDGRDGRVIYPFGMGQPTLTCAPERVCDIELERGEAVSNVAVGDSVRWQIAAAASENDRPHVIVKPVAEGLKTNLIITTSKRTYRITLKSDKNAYVTALAFSYPDELAKQWQQAAKEAKKEAERVDVHLPEFSIDHIDENYIIQRETVGNRWYCLWLCGGTKAPYAPQRVFDDGTHVYIQMPDFMQKIELPTLILRGVDGKEEIVNYRVVKGGKWLIVDKLFDRGWLLTGVGRNQYKISISYKGNRYE